MKKKQNQKLITYFKRWTRRKFAVFNSLKKQISISTIALACSFLAKPVDGEAQMPIADTIVQLQTVTVLAGEDALLPVSTLLQPQLNIVEIERAPVRSLNELLEFLPGLDVRQRGGLGVQADLSYRGGHFDQTAVCLNGIYFNDPQTGHYNLNLPLHPSLIHRIDIKDNTEAFLHGISSFSGMINLITQPKDTNSLFMNMCGGMYGYAEGQIMANLKTGKVRHLLSGNYIRSDGYKHNTDFETKDVFYQNQTLLKQGTLDFQTAYIDKKYGANAFYSLKYPDQYEATKTFLSSLRWIGIKRFGSEKHQASIVYIPSVYYRNNQDCFELIKGQSVNKNNYHRTQVLGGNFLLAFRPNECLQTSLSVSTREEDILSTSLGEQLYHPVESKTDSVFYKYRRTRNESNVTISQSFDYKGWSGAAAFMLEHFSDLNGKIHFLPSVYLKYTLSQNKEKYNHQEYFFLSASDAVRMPTFTDLYYKTGDIRGNKNLLSEKALNSELGFEWNMSRNKKRFLATRGVFFYRWGRNMIDYVKKENENMWNTINHTQVNFTGIEFSAQYLPNKHLSSHFFIHSIQIQYTYIHSDKKSMGYQSRYVLDHLTHHFLLQLNHKIIKGLELDYAFSANKRKGEYTSYKENSAGSSLPYSTYYLLDLRLRYTYKVATFYVEASNVLNVKYFDIGDLEQSGIWAKAGVSVSL